MPVFAFNADFDGDQMAVHLPLTNEAQAEARELMLASHGILKPATGDPVAIPSHDISFGCYYLTTTLEGAKGEGKVFGSRYEALLAYENDVVDLRVKIKVPDPDGGDKPKRDLIETTAGRIIFNKALPKGYRFINRSLTKPDLKKIEADIWDELGEEITVNFLNNIKDLGFYYATLSGVSFGMDDLRLPSEEPALIAASDKLIEENRQFYDDGLLTDYERKSKAIEIWN